MHDLRIGGKRAFVLCLLCLGGAALMAEPANGGEGLILDERAAASFYIRFGMDKYDPALLQAEGDKYLSAKDWKMLKDENKRIANTLHAPWDEEKWKQNAYGLFSDTQSSMDMGTQPAMGMPPPPANWMAPDFDDVDWPYQRAPFMTGVPAGANRDMVDAMGRVAGYYRYGFDVPDPAKAGELTLHVVFHGGARVFLNGKEMGRAFLPAGEITPETPATSYPVEAYVKCNPDGGIARWPDTDKYFKGEIILLGDIYGEFEKAPFADPRQKTLRYGRNTYAGGRFDKANWQRLQTLRDRVLDVKLPPDALKKGRNVLAVEIRASQFHPITAANEQIFRRMRRWSNLNWYHAQLLSMALRSADGAVPSAMAAPPGVQVWVEDMHRRVFSGDFRPAGSPVGTIRYTGAQNGTYSALIVIRADRKLEGLKLAPSELSAGQARLPAVALYCRAMRPQPVSRMVFLGHMQNGPPHWKNLLIPPAERALERYGPDGVGGLPREERLKAIEKIFFYDEIGEALPARLEADSILPVWVYLDVPCEAGPGQYEGSIKIEAQGMPPVSVPVTAEVIGWRLPAPRNFQTIVEVPQNPYGVAAGYDVPLWSDDHFRLIEKSFEQTARVGAKWVFIPVLNNMEFGNLQDTPIRWMHKKDGSLEFDFSIVDRYLDLAVKHLGKPRVVVLDVMYGVDSDTPQVQCLDETSGKVETLLLDRKQPHYAQAWKTFGAAAVDFMRRKGLADSMCWGFAWDQEGDPNLFGLLGEVAPNVHWTAGGHNRMPDKNYCATSSVYGNLGVNPGSRRGWKQSQIYLCNPRSGGTVMGLNGHSLPFGFRALPGRALCAGASGVARMGADYWGEVFMKNTRDPGWRAGMPVSYFLYPGQNAAHSSARFEALREGIQEAEARIYLEQLLDRKLLPDELARKAEQVLYDHGRATLFLPTFGDPVGYAENTLGWRDRSRELFAMAAEAAQTAGFSVTPERISAEIPPRGKKTVEICLRNWAPAARAWKAAADQPWLSPAKPEGEAAASQTLALTLDAARLAGEHKATATLTITDATGKSFPVAVTVSVPPLFEFIPPDATLDKNLGVIPDAGKLAIDVQGDAAGERDLGVINRADAAIAWKAAASVNWATLSPSSGKAPPGQPLGMKLTVKPPPGGQNPQSLTLTVVEDNGQEKLDVPVVVHVIPLYQPPQPPEGTPVPLDSALFKSLKPSPLNSILEQREWKRLEEYDKSIPEQGGEQETCRRRGHIGQKWYPRTLAGIAPRQVNLDIAGQGFKAFSAEVGVPGLRKPGDRHINFGADAKLKLNYEVYADDKLVAQSGFVGPDDPPRLVVATGLDGARKLTLLVRTNEPSRQSEWFIWADPKFYK